MSRNKRDVIFTLTNDDQIVIRSGGSITMQEMHCCNLAKIFLVQGNSEYVLSNFNVPFYHEPLNTFNDLVFKAIAGELKLPQAFTKDLGYIYNEYRIKERCKVFPMKVNIDDTLYTYKLFRSASRHTWLYNDNDGSIILEVSPNYPWNAFNKRASKLISFKKFLKNYSPFFKVKIPVDLAYQWLKQILDLKLLINKNVMKIREQRKNQNRDQYVDDLESDFDFSGTILFNMFGHMRKDLSAHHKEIFIKAGFSNCAHWWTSLTNTERENRINYDAEKEVRIYEEMP